MTNCIGKILQTFTLNPNKCRYIYLDVRTSRAFYADDTLSFYLDSYLCKMFFLNNKFLIYLIAYKLIMLDVILIIQIFNDITRQTKRFSRIRLRFITVANTAVFFLLFHLLYNFTVNFSCQT